jgi:hypothetical protein
MTWHHDLTQNLTTTSCHVENLDTPSPKTPAEFTDAFVFIEIFMRGMLVAEYFTPTSLGRFHPRFTA